MNLEQLLKNARNQLEMAKINATHDDKTAQAARQTAKAAKAKLKQARKLAKFSKKVARKAEDQAETAIEVLERAQTRLEKLEKRASKKEHKQKASLSGKAKKQTTTDVQMPPIKNKPTAVKVTEQAKKLNLKKTVLKNKVFGVNENLPSALPATKVKMSIAQPVSTGTAVRVHFVEYVKERENAINTTRPNH
jgi:N-acetylglucosamine kinase-like BadF-type ATPase